MTEWCVTLAVVGVLAGTGSAHAGAPLSTDYLTFSGNRYVRCVISNTSTKEVVVDKIESVDGLGNASTHRTTFTLAPGATEPNVFAPIRRAASSA